MNEDAYLVDEGHLLFGVFDGLGATAQAAQAARLVAEAIRAAYEQHGRGHDCAAERAFLPLAVRGAGTLIAATLEDGLTTASVVKVCNNTGGTTTALICNIGDSRIYRYTAAGELQQCTLDDSIFGSDWDLQLRLSEAVVPTGVLEYTYFEQRHVMDRALGESLATPHLWEVPAEDGDVLVAVSDGVTDNLTFSELRQLLQGAVHRPDQVAHRLVDAAYSRSRQPGHPRAKIDDITAVAAQVRHALDWLPAEPTNQSSNSGVPFVRSRLGSLVRSFGRAVRCETDRSSRRNGVLRRRRVVRAVQPLV